MSEFTFTRASSKRLGVDRFDVQTPRYGVFGWVWQHKHDRQWYWRGVWQAAVALLEKMRSVVR